jgi:hypothetical protein
MSPSASPVSTASKPLPTDDNDFTLWCLILMQLESWQPETKSREDTKLNVGAANAVNQKSEAWNLFEYKMSDPSHSILKKLQRSRSGTNVYDPSHHLAAEDTMLDSKSVDQSAASSSKTGSATVSKDQKESPAFNLRCMPLFLRALSTFQGKHIMSQNIVLKGSGYRILIKAARSIKERQENAITLSQKFSALKYRNDTLPVLLRLLPHVLHQVQDENWASFSMTLEFAWWLHEIAPVQLNFYGLHVLSCACVLGCR